MQLAENSEPSVKCEVLSWEENNNSETRERSILNTGDLTLNTF